MVESAGESEHGTLRSGDDHPDSRLTSLPRAEG